MKKIPVVQHDFYGGVADDIRHGNGNSFAITKHFDIFSSPSRLTPYRSLEVDTNDGSTSTGMKQYLVKDFVYASSSAKLFGLGQTGGGLTKIVQKADATTGNWSLPATSEGNGAVLNGCLVEYKAALWGFQGTNQVWKWVIATNTITNTVTGTLGATITSVAQGVIAKDDNLYLPYNNIIARVTAAGTLVDAVLTLPTNFKITSICNFGNYLAIGCAPVSTYNGTSKVFLWNLTSSDVQESIDWGEGELRILETIEGSLVGVTDRYLNNATGAGTGSMIIQMYGGGAPQVIKEVFTQALVGKTMPLSKAVKNNRIFFAAKIMTDTAGTTYNEGIWSFGRKNANYSHTMTLDIIDENIDTDGIQGFGMAANYFFIAHSGDGSIDKTDDTAAYAFTSVLETTLFDAGDVTADKTLLSLDIAMVKLATGQTLTTKYKVDGATSWTTIGTHSTVGAISYTFLNEESNSNVMFASGREYQFRIESTGGLEITGFLATFTINSTPS